jgi:hypothetical protein
MVLYVDTTNVPIHFTRRPRIVRFYSKAGARKVTPTQNTVVIPAGTQMTEILW